MYSDALNYMSANDVSLTMRQLVHELFTDCNTQEVCVRARTGVCSSRRHLQLWLEPRRYFVSTAGRRHLLDVVEEVRVCTDYDDDDDYRSPPATHIHSDNTVQPPSTVDDTESIV
jgi:hypothetical protein